MKAQEPAVGILSTGSWGTMKTYTIQCDCGQSCDSHDVIIEADDHNVTLFIYHTKKTKWYEMNRWKQIWQILTKGYSEMQSELVMNEQTALNYASTLMSAIEDAIEDVKKIRNEK